MTAPRAACGLARAFMVILCTLITAGWRPAGAEDLAFTTQFQVALTPGEPAARARIRVTQPAAYLKTLRLSMPASLYSAVTGDGTIARQGDTVTWEVPARGGELRYRVLVTHQRNSKGYDAYVARQWALFRAEKVFPSAHVTLRAGARGRGELLLELPAGWSSQTPYLPDELNRRHITPRGRAYARPVGWILAGQIGSRKDVVGPTTIRVAAPAGQPAPRVPALALARSTLRILQAEIPVIPAYLLIVMAADPMWRGGLSAPNSLFLHADRPLISENGTSALVHELMHVLVPVPSAAEHDWIDEGLAEYLGLRVMLQSDTISRERYDHAIEVFRRRGAGVRSLVTRNAHGEITARAVAIFSDVDRELQNRTGSQRDIFDLVRRLMQERKPVDAQRLRELAAGIAGGSPLNALAPGKLPGTRPAHPADL